MTGAFATISIVKSFVPSVLKANFSSVVEVAITLIKVAVENSFGMLKSNLAIFPPSDDIKNFVPLSATYIPRNLL
tara:strand:- start:46 stop:270 length:225 start_codon:yes stop_codon:yes gene_type:complete